MVAKARSLSSNLRVSPRDALVALADQLASEIDAAETARDRLPLVRAFLAAVAQLEALDRAARHETRLAARLAAGVDSGGPQTSVIDELRERRKRRAR